MIGYLKAALALSVAVTTLQPSVGRSVPHNGATDAAEAGPEPAREPAPPDATQSVQSQVSELDAIERAADEAAGNACASHAAAMTHVDVAEHSFNALLDEIAGVMAGDPVLAGIRARSAAGGP